MYVPVRVAVVGLGNVLMGDDGFGPYVVHTLEASHEIRPGAALVDAGTPGLDLASWCGGLEALIVVDTVRSDGPPGTLRLYRREQILQYAPQPRAGPHDPGLKETLCMLDFAGRCPGEVLLVGVIPARTEADPHLSEPVRSAVPHAVLAVLDELARLGFAARPRARRRAAAIWWEK